ncbi:hypothetical protein [Pedobacter frigoris]|uniref:Redoxin domain-containing protein n=1 Tax=Pedobacter frigoris TaxID=2571272 RepID=A0A4U1CK35_9SPHI|nr:hypothetical protein [Pedobacter frigoris]TKC07192.1 hypothetical protein FA047_08005 [Pedobacter frigoris]
MANLNISRVISVFAVITALWALFLRTPVANPAKHQQFNRLDAIRLDNYKTYVKDAWSDDGKKINMGRIIYDDQDNSYRLRQLVPKPKLILRYSFADCEMCIDTLMTHLGKAEFKGLRENTLILNDSFSKRDFAIKIKHTKSPVKIFNIGSEPLGFLNENKNQPILFTLNPEGVATRFYFPMKELGNDLDVYLSTIQDVLNK